MQDTFRPPWFHRNVASEFMGLVHGAYDAKAEGLRARRRSLHNCMSGHGPDAATFEKASRADTSKPARRSTTRWRSCSRRRCADPADAVRARVAAAAARLRTVLAGLAKHFDAGSGRARHGPSAQRDPRPERCSSWVDVGQRRRHATSRSRTCRSPSSAARAAAKRSAAASRSATRSSTSARCTSSRPFAGAAAQALGACAAPGAECASWRMGRAASVALRAALSQPLRARLRPQRAHARRAARAAGRGRVRACRPDRRLHRLLHRRSITRPPSASCSGPTTRCCPTTSGCRSAITAAPRRSASRGTDVRAPAGPDACRPAPSAPEFGPTRSGSTTSSSSASSSAAATRSAQPIADRRGRDARLRPVPAQRLVGARHPGLGIPAARAVPGEELRHHGVALDRDAGGARAVPRAVDAAGGDPQPLPYLDGAAIAAAGAIDMQLEVWLADARACAPPASRRSGCRTRTSATPTGRSRSWSRTTPCNGCNLQPGRPARHRHAVGPGAGRRPARCSS